MRFSIFVAFSTAKTQLGVSLLKVQKNIKSIARETLLMEARSIEKLVDYIDQKFEDCVRAILSSKGRVVITGIGKSANIGLKIVSTLNSTGTPSLFMHAADAIHGDLGMIQSEDIVICISKSGNTPEIKVLVPLLKRTGSKLVALVGNVKSYLAQNSDFILNATVDREADPNDLAPTTSTTATLALGDALAVSLLSCRDFDKTDFAKLHPGGALGKKLYLKVADVYPGNELPSVGPNASVNDVIMEISSKRLGATAVTDDDGKLLGVVTDGDLRRMLNQNLDAQSLTAKDIMSISPKTINEDSFAIRAFELMKENNITQTIVVDENLIVKGIIHLHDLLREGIV